MIALLQRDLLLAVRAGGGFGLGVAFFLIVVGFGAAGYWSGHGDTIKSFCWCLVGWCFISLRPILRSNFLARL